MPPNDAHKTFSYSLNDNDLVSNSATTVCLRTAQDQVCKSSGSFSSYADFYAQFFSEQPQYESGRTGVIKEFRNMFLEHYLEKNNVGRKSKPSVKSKSRIIFSF